MEGQKERLKRFAEMHVNARHQAGKSQEFMAMELGVSNKTVRNWEKGISSPTFFQSLEWFHVLNINPFYQYLTVLYPDIFGDLKGTSDDDKIEEAFDTLVHNLPIKDKRALMYIYYGNHGSSAYSLLQLILAYLHTPLQTRTSQATITVNMFELEKELGNLICTDNIMPDMDDLNHALKLARLAVLNKEYGYSVVNKNT